MRNEINKIIITLDNNKLIDLVVLENNNVKRYSLKDMTNDKLMEQYTKAVLKIKRSCYKELEGLDSQSAINKLCSLNKIIINNDKLLTEIDIDFDKFTVFYDKEFKVFYRNDFKDTNSYNNELKKHLNELTIKYNMSIDELKRFHILRDYKALNKVVKDNHVRNLLINKRVLSGIVASTIALSGIGYGISRLFRSKDDIKLSGVRKDVYESVAPNPTKEVYPKVSDELWADSGIIFDEPIETPTPDMLSKEIYFESEHAIFGDYLEYNDPSLIATQLGKRNYFINGDSSEDIKMFNELRINDMLSICENTKNEDSCYIYYEKGFKYENLKEKAFIKYFSMLGNNIIRYAYSDEKNTDKLNEAIDYNIIEYLKYIKDDMPLIFNIYGQKQKVRFSDLSYKAKTYLLNIVWLNNITFKNREIEYLGVHFNQSDIYGNIVAMSNPELSKNSFVDSDGNFDNMAYEDALYNWHQMLNSIVDKDDYSLYYNEPDLDTNYFSVVSQKREIISSYKSSTNPFKSRFSQGRSGYGNIKFENSTIRKSGCGICAFASGLSCVLTNEYGENISINPEQLLKILKKSNSGHSYRSGNGLVWNEEESPISVDITNCFRDICVLELKATTPTFNEKTLSLVTSAGCPVVVSLNGRGHIVCVTSNNEDGKFYVADSDRGYSSPVSINTSIVRSDNKKRGNISAKKAWILVPNNRIEVIGNEIKIKDLDLSKIPAIGRFEINGQSYQVSINESKGTMKVDGLSKELFEEESDYKFKI